MSGGRAAAAVIHLDALRHNLECVRGRAPASKVLAVVKANAYGHGLTGIASALGGADAFAVACIDEARQLRSVSPHKPIVLLEGIFDAAELVEAAALRCELVVHDAWQVDALVATPNGHRFVVWLKIDTGMHRLGFAPGDATAAFHRLKDLPAVAEMRLMTHLACADDPSHPMTTLQLNRFATLTEGWAGARSIANSAAVFALPATHADWIRPGLALYGVSPFAARHADALGLRAVMTLKARLMAIRTVPAGDTVGYQGTWRAERDTRVGIVDIGYGDGYPRQVGPGTPVLVGGQRCRLVGRVSMDMLSVDLTAVPAARVGDEVVLWGRDLPVEEIAECAGTIPWTLLCGVTERVRMEYR